MTRGLVIGKFMPPHAGHTYLIDVARAQCDRLAVMVCAKPDQPIPGVLRTAWLREAHPDVEVIEVDDRLDVDDGEVWAVATRRALGYVPDVVFSSEPYGDAFAEYLGARHVCVDPQRRQIPISATRVRADPRAAAAFLAPAVRAYYTPRVVFAGAESTGKTTLARALAARYGWPWVPEYGRAYTEAKYRDGMATDAWTPAEFVHIAREQARREEAVARTVPVVIADTDAWVTGIWYERYLGARPDGAGWPLDAAAQRVYLIPEPDVPFERDGIRDGESFRGWMHERMHAELARLGMRVVPLSGDRANREHQAGAAIDTLLAAHPAGSAPWQVGDGA